MDTVIRTSGLERRYGSRRGIDGINLAIQQGEIFGFLGPNGAGKSTTIRVLLGFLKASAGEARIFDLDCWSKSAVIKQRVGYVPGDVRLYPWLTLNKALQFLTRIRHTQLTQNGLELAERFQLEPDLPVRKMSRGNRQKLALIAALAHRPDLIVMDEPTSGLDPLMQETLCDCLRETAQAGGTVFFSSHTLSEVETLCDRIAIVREGTVVVDEPLQSLKQRAPRHVSLELPPDASDATFDWPTWLIPRQHFRGRYEFELQATPQQFIRWAAEQPLADITISPPSLEALFRGYYEATSTGKEES
ncbi:MAG: ABC transporter ATP-binding protein [Planctomycetaceae bacterium]|nr:ABC transporter ATP-binding protein [Planctomycetaceae bacterium]